MTTAKVLLDKVDHVKNFVNITEKLDTDMDLVVGRYTIDAKSLMGIFSMNLTKPIEIHIHEDEEKAAPILEQLKDYLV